MANCFVSLEDSQTAELTAFWVAPKQRGQGVGAALLASVADWAAAQGVTTLQAWVVEDNHRAIGFYQKVGFTETGRRQPHTPDPSKQIVRLTYAVRTMRQNARLHGADATNPPLRGDRIKPT